jgi:hypothetical protein
MNPGFFKRKEDKENNKRTCWFPPLTHLSSPFSSWCQADPLRTTMPPGDPVDAPNTGHPPSTTISYPWVGIDYANNDFRTVEALEYPYVRKRSPFDLVRDAHPRTTKSTSAMEVEETNHSISSDDDSATPQHHHQPYSSVFAESDAAATTTTKHTPQPLFAAPLAVSQPPVSLAVSQPTVSLATVAQASANNVVVSTVVGRIGMEITGGKNVARYVPDSRRPYGPISPRSPLWGLDLGKPSGVCPFYPPRQFLAFS